MLWLIVASIGMLGMLYEDIRFRLVHVYWYPVVVPGLLGLALEAQVFYTVLQQTGQNMLFISLLLFVLTLYFSIKEKKLVNLFANYMGWGDVLFFLSAVVYFPLDHYILFFIITVLVALLLTPIFYRLQGKDRHIPLAGIQAGCLMLYCWLQYFGLFSLPHVFMLE